MADTRAPYNNQGGTLGASLTSSGTTITFATAPNFATISGNFIPIILEPGTANFEIVYLTAYTAAATTGTITRQAEDSTNWPKVAHSNGVAWVCAPTLLDVATVPGALIGIHSAATGNITMAASSSFTSAMTALDTTNFTLSFTVPQSGNVLVEAEFTYEITWNTSGSYLLMGILNHTGGAQLGDNIRAAVISVTAESTLQARTTCSWYLTGLTPGALQVDLAAYITPSGASGIIYGTQGTGTTNDGGAVILKAFAA